MQNIIFSAWHTLINNIRNLFLQRYIWKNAILFTLTIYIILFILFLVTGVYQTSEHVTKIRILKSIVLWCTIVIALQALFCKNKNQSYKKYTTRIIISLFIPITWMSLYTYVFIASDGTLDRIGYYYDSSILFFCISFILLTLISLMSKGKYIAIFLYPLITFIFLIPTIIYGVYYQIYHSVIREIGLLSILATTKEEAVNYLLTIFTTEQIVLIVIALLILFTQTSHPKNIYNHNNIAVMQLLTFRTDRQN